MPVARSKPTANYLRSAAARSVLEALWVPAALLPRNGVRWKPVDNRRAPALFVIAGEEFVLELTVADDGSPMCCVSQRWTNANPEQVYRWQPVGGIVEELATLGGYTIPARMSAGNQFGTKAYFPFFRARIKAARFC